MASNTRSSSGEKPSATPSNKVTRSAADQGKGQKVSSERGSATRSKKNPGKRAHQGGGAR